MNKPVNLSSLATKQYKKLENKDQERIKKSLYKLSEDFTTGDIKKLRGINNKEALFRLRVGDFRVIFYPDKESIKIIRIEKRSQDYNWLE